MTNLEGVGLEGGGDVVGDVLSVPVLHQVRGVHEPVGVFHQHPDYSDLVLLAILRVSRMK